MKTSALRTWLRQERVREHFRAWSAGEYFNPPPPAWRVVGRWLSGEVMVQGPPGETTWEKFHIDSLRGHSTKPAQSLWIGTFRWEDACEKGCTEANPCRWLGCPW